MNEMKESKQDKQKQFIEIKNRIFACGLNTMYGYHADREKVKRIIAENVQELVACFPYLSKQVKDEFFACYEKDFLTFLKEKKQE